MRSVFTTLALAGTFVAAQSSSGGGGGGSSAGGSSGSGGGGGGGNGVSTSYSLAQTLLITNGGRVITTVSVPIPITVGAASPTPAPSSTGGGGGGNNTISNGSFSRNTTQTVSGGGGTVINGTGIQSSIVQTSTTPTTLPIAPTLDPGGGGTTVAAPVPGGTGSLPQGPGDGYNNAALKVGATLVGLIVTVASIAAGQLMWTV